jgi:uncharacterized protein (DUF1330 family)
MQAKCAAILLGSVALAGSVMTSALAQNVPYVEVGEINVKDQKGYEASGVGKVREVQEAVGCKLIAGGYNKAQGMIGNPPENRFLVIRCPDKAAMEKHWEAVTKWWDSEGHKFATLRAIGVEGNAVPIEPGAYYQIVEINVKDQPGYEGSGVKEVRATQEAVGGKLIGGGYNKATSLVGDPPANRYLIIQYPSKAANDKHFTENVKPWWESEGRKYSDFRAVGAEGVAPK